MPLRFPFFFLNPYTGQSCKTTNRPARSSIIRTTRCPLSSFFGKTPARERRAGRHLAGCRYPSPGQRIRRVSVQLSFSIILAYYKRAARRVVDDPLLNPLRSSRVGRERERLINQGRGARARKDSWWWAREIDAREKQWTRTSRARWLVAREREPQELRSSSAIRAARALSVGLMENASFRHCA